MSEAGRIVYRIQGDNSNFKASLREVEENAKKADGEIRSLNSELNAVDNIIRQTGLTSEMAAQKQALLSAEIAATTNKLEQLRNAQADIEAEVQAGNILAEQYRAYQREVASTEAALRRLNDTQQELTNQLNGTGELEETAEAAQTLDDVINSLNSELNAVNGVIQQTGLTNEMAAQKQTLLARQIEATTQRLEELRAAQNGMGAENQAIDVNNEQYRECQREIALTENALRQLNNEQSDLEEQMWQAAHAGEAFGGSMNDASNSMSNAGETSLTLADIIKGNLISDALGKLAELLKDGAVALKDFAVEGIELASNLTEVQNVVDVTFGADSAIYDWADTVSGKFGLAKLSAEQYAGTMGAMLKSSGINEGLEEMSMRIAELAGDMASFYNLDSDTAFEKIRSGISGETEPLKQLGINMSVVNLEAFAMSQGIDKSWESMSQAEQTLLRYNYLMEQTADAQGDFSRTSDSLANQQRILELNLQNVKTELGEQLLPIMQNFLVTLNENMPEIQAAVGNLASELAPKLSELADKVTDFMADEGIPALIDALEWLVDNGDTVVKIAGTFAAAWAVDKISGFTGNLAQIPDATANSLKSLSAIATKMNTSVSTAFSNLGHHASNAMSTMRNAVTGAETASIASFAAITVAAAAAVASIAKIADELDTIAEGMNNITVENQKSTDNIVSLNDTWAKISNMSGIEKYNEINAFYDDVLKKQEEWNGRYKTTIDELNTLQEKKFKTADETARMKELQAQKDSLDAEYQTLELYHVKAQNALEKYDNETIRRLQESAEQQAIARENAGKTNAEAVSSAWDKIRETTAAKMQELDDQLATHSIDESSYWRKRKEYLEAHRDEENKEWWKWYDDVTEHYEKLSETEAKAADKATKERESALKESVEDKFRELETEQRQKGYDDSWLLEQERAFVETIDHNTETYKDYNLSLLKEQEKVNAALLKAQETAANKQKEALKKSYEDIVKSRDKLADSLKIPTDIIFTSEEVTDKRTGAKKKNRDINLDNFEKKLAAKKKLTSKIANLLEANAPESLISELLKQDPEDALIYANELLRNPSKLSDIKATFKENEGVSGILANMVTEDSSEFEKLGTEAGNAFGESFTEAFHTNWESTFESVFSDKTISVSASAINSANATAASESTYVRNDSSPADSGGGAASWRRSAGTAQSGGTYKVVDLNGKYIATVVNTENRSAKIQGGG